jgi:hypothetical protein
MPNASWRRRGVATARGGGSPTLATERSGSGKGGAKRRAAQAKRGSLGKPLAGARGGAPLPCLLSRVRRREVLVPASMAWIGLEYSIPLGPEPGNVQRQSLKLPYADWLPQERVSSQVCLGLSSGVGEKTPAHGALEDHHDQLPGSGPNRSNVIQL